MKKRHVIISLIILVMLVIIGGVAYSVSRPDTNSNDEEIRKKFNCDRVTADARATDVYCQDPSLYRQDLEKDKNLNPSDAI